MLTISRQQKLRDIHSVIRTHAEAEAEAETEAEEAEEGGEVRFAGRDARRRGELMDGERQKSIRKKLVTALFQDETTDLGKLWTQHTALTDGEWERVLNVMNIADT